MNSDMPACPVCYGENQLRTLNCAHVVCRPCWRRIPGNKCPLCRAITQPLHWATRAAQARHAARAGQRARIAARERGIRERATREARARQIQEEQAARAMEIRARERHEAMITELEMDLYARAAGLLREARQLRHPSELTARVQREFASRRLDFDAANF